MKIVKIGNAFKKKKSVVSYYALIKIMIKRNIKRRPLFVLSGIFLIGRGQGTYRFPITCSARRAAFPSNLVNSRHVRNPVFLLPDCTFIALPVIVLSDASDRQPPWLPCACRTIPQFSSVSGRMLAAWPDPMLV